MGMGEIVSLCAYREARKPKQYGLCSHCGNHIAPDGSRPYCSVNCTDPYVELAQQLGQVQKPTLWERFTGFLWFLYDCSVFSK